MKALFNGRFCPKESLKELMKWNKIFSPLNMGLEYSGFVSHA